MKTQLPNNPFSNIKMKSLAEVEQQNLLKKKEPAKVQPQYDLNRQTSQVPSQSSAVKKEIDDII